MEGAGKGGKLLVFSWGVQVSYPPPPLQSPVVARDGLPGGGGRRSPSDGVPGGGGGDCKGISRQTVVPSTDASKENWPRRRRQWRAGLVWQPL